MEGVLIITRAQHKGLCKCDQEPWGPGSYYKVTRVCLRQTGHRHHSGCEGGSGQKAKHTGCSRCQRGKDERCTQKWWGRTSLWDVSYSATQGLRRALSTSSKATKRPTPRDEGGQTQEQSLRVAASKQGDSKQQQDGKPLQPLAKIISKNIGLCGWPSQGDWVSSHRLEGATQGWSTCPARGPLRVCLRLNVYGYPLQKCNSSALEGKQTTR